MMITIDQMNYIAYAYSHSFDKNLLFYKHNNNKKIEICKYFNRSFQKYLKYKHPMISITKVLVYLDHFKNYNKYCTNKYDYKHLNSYNFLRITYNDLITILLSRRYIFHYCTGTII